MRLCNVKKMRHDVKPRVLCWLFSRKFMNADAQTKILPASNATRQEHRFIAFAPEIDTGKIGRKSRRERTLYPKP